jgi:hypothetical protein
MSEYFHVPNSAGSLKTIAISRRFSKLLEEIRDDETGEQVAILLKQLEKDIAKFEKMKASRNFSQQLQQNHGKHGENNQPLEQNKKIEITVCAN